MSESTTKAGRKKRAIPMHTYRVPLDGAIVEAIKELRPDAALAPSRWCALAISQAHGYDAFYLPSEMVRLVSTAPSPEDLSAFVTTLTGEDTGSTGEHGQPMTIRLDKPLAERINAHCARNGMSYSGYLREVIRYATGCPRPEVTGEQMRAAM